jgi:hypothetical protein
MIPPPAERPAIGVPRLHVQSARHVPPSCGTHGSPANDLRPQTARLEREIPAEAADFSGSNLSITANTRRPEWQPVCTKNRERHVMTTLIRNIVTGYCVVLSVSVPAFAQPAGPSPARASAPPVHAVVALEDTMKKFYRAANIALVAARDGVEHAYWFTTDVISHGGRNSGHEAVAALGGLREGTVVVIQSVNDEDRMETEGWVAHVDRGRNQITVKYDDGTVDVLRLTERAAAATWPEEEQAIAAQAAGAEAAVYYNDEDGRRVVHFFRWVR